MKGGRGGGVTATGQLPVLMVHPTPQKVPWDLCSPQQSAGQRNMAHKIGQRNAIDDLSNFSMRILQWHVSKGRN